MLLVKDAVYVEPLRIGYMSDYSIDNSIDETRTCCRPRPNPIPK